MKEIKTDGYTGLETAKKYLDKDLKPIIDGYNDYTVNGSLINNNKKSIKNENDYPEEEM